MKVERIIGQKRAVYSIQPGEPISKAVKLMNEKHIGALMVVDENQNIKGIVTERDILQTVVRENFLDILVKDIMTPKEKLITSNKNNDLRYVMSIMTENNIRHIPIVDNEKLVALISVRDVIRILLEDADYGNRVLMDYMSGTDLD